MSNPLEARRPDGPNPFIPPPQAGAVPDLTLGGAVDVVRRHSRLLLWLPLLALVAAVALSMMRPRTYTASTSFTPQATDGQRSALAGAAAQFGISLASAQNSESPAFYAALLTSHELLGELADSSFTVPVDGQLRKASLADLYEIEAPSAAARREAAIQLLQGGIAVSTSRETSIVSLSVTTRWAALSQELAARALALVNEFNLQRRQSRAAAERRFIEGRLRDATSALRAAEDQTEGFLEGNRDFSNSPQLRFRYDRLQRQVANRQEVVSTLTSAYEQARIDEVRNLPVITVLDSPAVPVRPNARGTASKGVVAALFGFILAIVFAFLHDASVRLQLLPRPEGTSLWRRLFRRRQAGALSGAV